MGAMAKDKSRASRKLIAEALLTATSVLGDITISKNNLRAYLNNNQLKDSEHNIPQGDLTASDFDNLAGLIDDEQIAKLKNHEKSKIGDVTISQKIVKNHQRFTLLLTIISYQQLPRYYRKFALLRPSFVTIGQSMNTTSGPLVPQVKFSTQFTNLAAYS